MSSRVSKLVEDKIDISRGDWLMVKRRLNAGEYRAYMNSYMRIVGADAAVDPIMVGQSLILAYLLDWNITDSNDQPMVIRDQPPDVVAACLDALDYEDWQEIKAAIEAHEAKWDKVRAEEKKARSGESKSAPTLRSPAHSDGAMSGSLDSIEMSTTS